MYGAAALVTAGFNYLYHLVLAHVLGPRGYGDLATYLNITAVLVLPAPVVTLIYTRVGRPRGRARWHAFGLWSGGLGLWAACAAMSRWLAQVLHIEPALVVIYTVEVIPSLALAANLGILQRARWYLWAGLLTVVNTMFRVVAASLALLAHLFPLVMVGLLEGVAAWVTWGLSRRWSRRAPMRGESSPAPVIFGAAAVGTLNVLYAIADGILAKYALPPLAAGRFNGLATIGHTVQFMSGSFGTVMFTAMLAEPAHTRRWLAITVAAYSALALATETVFWTAGGWVTTVVLGRPFLPIALWLGWYGWGMLGLGLTNIGLLYALIQKQWAALTVSAVGLVVWVVQLGLSHSLAEFVTATVRTTPAIAALVWLTVGIARAPARRLEV